MSKGFSLYKGKDTAVQSLKRTDAEGSKAAHVVVGTHDPDHVVLPDRQMGIRHDHRIAVLLNTQNHAVSLVQNLRIHNRLPAVNIPVR